MLLVLVTAELLRVAFGVETPAWLLFPAIGLIAVEAVAVGYALGQPSP